MGALKEAYAAGEYEADVSASKKNSAKTKLLLLSKEYPITRSDAQALARNIARDATRIATSAASVEEQTDQLEALCDSFGIEYPESDFGRHCELARLKEAGWWGRKIRVSDWRDYEERQLRLGRIRQFVSDDIARARRWHREAIAQLLENLTAIRDDEQAIMSIAELMQTSTAHLPIRRAEMLTRFKGVATHCAAKGWTWTFITLTAPSKFHRMRTRKDEGGHKRLYPNPRWDDFGGPTPRDTQAYHNKVYARIRAELARKKIRYSVLRTVEPHADGTPHWHMAVFVAPEHLAELKAIFRKHALKMDGDEDGAEEHRFTAKDYDPAEGDMVDRCIAYLITYVAKNIDGTGVLLANDDGGEGEKMVVGEAIEMARRVEAWATLWGIRQFQIAGGGRVTGYRELRRLREPILHDMAAEVIRQAADAGDYAGYMAGEIRHQLELWTDTSASKLRREAVAAGVDKFNDDGTPTDAIADLAVEQNVFNRWGEPVRHYVHGVVIEGRHHLTRLHTWRVVGSEEVERIAHDAAKRTFLAAAGLGRSDALALAPGSCFGSGFSSGAQRRDLGPVSLTVRRASVDAAEGPPPRPPAAPETRHRGRQGRVKHPDYLHFRRPFDD